MMFLRAKDRDEIFRRLREMEQNLALAVDQFKGHAKSCRKAAKRAVYAQDRAAEDRKAFRREMRALCVSILVAVIGALAGAKFDLW